MLRIVSLLLLCTACGAKETYIPQPPNPQDFGVTGVLATADTSDSGAADTATLDTGTAGSGGAR